MTVTYRRAAKEGGGGAGGGGGFAGNSTGGGGNGGSTAPQQPVQPPCTGCNTSFEVRVDAREAVVFQVRGATCRKCNPHHPSGSTRPRGRRVVTMVPTHPSGGSPRIETLSEDVAGKSAVYLPERLVAVPHREQASGTGERINTTWREAVEPAISAVVGEESWHAVKRVWQPAHCEQLEAVTEALDHVWASTVPAAEETMIVLRVVGLAAVVAALVVEVAERSARTAREPIPLTGELLNLTAIAVCAGTENAVTCARLRRELESVPEVPDEGLLRLLDGGYRLALTATSSAITIDDFLPGLRVRREPIEAEADCNVAAPTGPIGQSRVVTARAVDGPSSTAIFGES